MRFRVRVRRSPIINIVSLIDILCIVLIFFIVTTTFRREEPQIKLELPKATTAKPAQQTTPEIITVTEDEKVYLGDKQVDPDSLGALLKERKEEDATAKFALKASKRAPFEVVVKVMDAVKIAGIDELPTYTADINPAPPAVPAPDAEAPAANPASSAPAVPSP